PRWVAVAHHVDVTVRLVELGGEDVVAPRPDLRAVVRVAPVRAAHAAAGRVLAAVIVTELVHGGLRGHVAAEAEADRGVRPGIAGSAEEAEAGDTAAAAVVLGRARWRKDAVIVVVERCVVAVSQIRDGVEEAVPTGAVRRHRRAPRKGL